MKLLELDTGDALRGQLAVDAEGRPRDTWPRLGEAQQGKRAHCFVNTVRRGRHECHCGGRRLVVTRRRLALLHTTNARPPCINLTLKPRHDHRRPAGTVGTQLRDRRLMRDRAAADNLAHLA
jgi:hypothetical protein